MLLSDHGQDRTQRFLTWLRSKFSGAIDVCYTKLRNPTDFEDIYVAANEAVSAALSSSPGLNITFHVSPGTPAMAAVWVLLAKAKYACNLIETSREHGVRPVVVPFDLAAEFLPIASKRADETLSQLVQGLPPASPEFSNIIHRCGPMKRVVAMAQRLAQRDLPVLIQGESGTGKELFARAIHASSKRSAAPFVAVNCGAIPLELIDSELFGHEKGAFTGAHTARVGHFESADGGTLFLDELGELPLSSQVRLLRVLQEREITRLGASKTRKVDVRIIAATNRILPDEVRAGRFREDVFHRIAVGILVLPPLRKREGDINLLIDALLAQINREAISQPGFEHKRLSVGARNLLLRHPWPGNVRELHNALLRASIWVPGEEMTAEDVAEVLALTSSPADDAILGAPLGEAFSLPDLMGDVARHYLERAMAQSLGNKTEAAKLLGLGSYQTLTNWLVKYQLKIDGTNGA
ncbi:sigma-54 interaction domain-containing protein [Methylomonas rapida]|uniref:Sigma 54-interacting transcriptional regulator n=1 Tax=Methylomonas rapida TaxID=2963939 RepID=A0ABY7GEW5_9GAMM|nr:sigma 54-interacting transcriptional regulator [Methylomonas rapida]WAR43532.1 sigma 54-interacting transcriptional regulator [Methylomonas rapida]